ncbi:unnamed protein product [Cylicocyclus nassatus]|uniref:SCP domain-containing protein n=1 Tax=Cylicocyclus nassatus TaxID=53992 RepID=A0AA36DRL8_CYLNA|nr:unnamed protein product [Cylicocyclus nassatus]
MWETGSACVNGADCTTYPYFGCSGGLCIKGPDAQAYSCSNTGLTDAIRDQILNYHNAARLRVTKGIEPNNVGLLNPAKNMYRLEWDCNMEQQAQAAIASCPGNLGTWSNMAQNLVKYTSTGSFSNPTTQINSALNTWWGAARQYGVTDSKNRYRNSNHYSFANMVFPETTKIGCAYRICPGATNTMTITCLYNGIGYFINQVMWETGSACVNGADCTTYPYSGCSGGLCIKGPDVPDTNYICPNNYGMTDAVRQRFLSLHNSYRSSLARGLEPDALGGYAPKASKMLKMVYDCSVEASAIRNANKCVYAHSTDAERPNLGENIWFTTAQNFDKVKAATQASQYWWDELEEYGIGPSNNLTLAIWNRPNDVGHYTQSTLRLIPLLRCAVTSCSGFTYVVCQYGPRGNFLNNLIYTIGNPCTGCGSYTCSVAEGLCNVV